MNIQSNGIGVFSKKQKLIIVMVLVVIISCILIVAAALVNRGSQLASNEIEEYLSELSYQTLYKVNQRIDTNLNTLLRLKDDLTIVADSNVDNVIENTLYHSAFKEIGYINDQGILVGKDKKVDVSHTNIMTDLKNGNANSISNQLVEIEDGQKGIVYAIKCDTSENKIALGGLIPTDTMMLLMNTETFEGVGFSHIVSTNGDFILASQNGNAKLNKGNNFFEEFEKKAKTASIEDVNAMEKDMKNGGHGRIEYSLSESGTRSLTYFPLE